MKERGTGLRPCPLRRNPGGWERGIAGVDTQTEPQPPTRRREPSSDKRLSLKGVQCLRGVERSQCSRPKSEGEKISTPGSPPLAERGRMDLRVPTDDHL